MSTSPGLTALDKRMSDPRPGSRISAGVAAKVPTLETGDRLGVARQWVGGRFRWAGALVRHPLRGLGIRRDTGPEPDRETQRRLIREQCVAHRGSRR